MTYVQQTNYNQQICELDLDHPHRRLYWGGPPSFFEPIDQPATPNGKRVKFGAKSDGIPRLNIANSGNKSCTAHIPADLVAYCQQRVTSNNDQSRLFSMFKRFLYWSC